MKGVKEKLRKERKMRGRKDIKKGKEKSKRKKEKNREDKYLISEVSNS